MYFYEYNLKNCKEVKELIDKVVRTVDEGDIVKEGEKSTVNGLQYQLYNKKNEIKPISDSVKDIIENIFLVEVELCSCWTIYGKEGTYHTIHNHNNNDDIATVLYLETTKESFPHGSFYFVHENNVYSRNPKPGDLYIFPVTLLHGVYPQGRGLRQTLNMDFSRKI